MKLMQHSKQVVDMSKVQEVVDMVDSGLNVFIILGRNTNGYLDVDSVSSKYVNMLIARKVYWKNNLRILWVHGTEFIADWGLSNRVYTKHRLYELDGTVVDALGYLGNPIDEDMYQQLVASLRKGLDCHTLIVGRDIETVGTPTHTFRQRLRYDGVYATPSLFINKIGVPDSMCFNVLRLVEVE